LDQEFQEELNRKKTYKVPDRKVPPPALLEGRPDEWVVTSVMYG
jgi:hypothetical protein